MASSASSMRMARCVQLGASLLAADADEVRIGAASAFGVADDQAAAALAAVDGALEVVRVFAVLLAGEVVGGQQLLDFVPSLGVDEGSCLPW